MSIQTPARSRVPAGVRSGGQFATEERPEPGVSLVQEASGDTLVRVQHPVDTSGRPMYEGPASGAVGHLFPGTYAATSLDGKVAYSLSVDAPVAPPDLGVTIFDPGDPCGMPVYEGPAGAAGTALEPGRYEALDLEDGLTPYVVIVPGPVDWRDTQRRGNSICQAGTVAGTPVAIDWEVGSSETGPVHVRIGDENAREYGQTYFEPAENGWRAFSVDGGVRYGIATRDAAIADIVERYVRQGRLLPDRPTWHHGAR